MPRTTTLMMVLIAGLTACSAPTARVRDPVSHHCSTRLARCDGYNVDQPFTATCDPETGFVGSCVPGRHPIHEGEPCELIEGAAWTHLRDCQIGPEPSMFFVPGAFCLPPLEIVNRCFVAARLVRRDEVQPPATIRCGTGSVVLLSDGCPTDAPIRPHDDAPAVPDENGCTPLTCTSAARDCGIGLDGCGHYLDCGECTIFSSAYLNVGGYAAAASPQRGQLYVVRYAAEHRRRIVALSREDLTEQASLDAPFDVDELVVDDAAGLLYARGGSFVDEPVDLGIVDLASWTFRTLDLGTTLEPPTLGSASVSAAALAVIPGRPDRIAVYLYLPVWHVVGGPYRARQTLGLALYDPIAGTRVFMPEPAINVPAVRSLFAGPEGVMPAGLDQPLLLRRFEIHGDRVGPWTDSAPNHHVELSESRWRDPSYFGDRIIDSAGVLLDGAGTELDLLNASDPVRTEGFAADPDGDRFYGAIDHGVEAFDAATHRSIAYMEVWATRTDPYPHPSDRMLWLGDRRLALLRRAEDAASYAITVFQSDGVAP